MKKFCSVTFTNARVVLFSGIFCILNGVLLGANEQGSSRLNFSSFHATTNNSIFLEDDKFSVINANLGSPSAIGFFDRRHKSSVRFGIDRTVTSLGAIATQLTNNVFKVEIDVQIVYNSITPSGGVLSSNLITLAKTLTTSFSGFNAHTMAGAPSSEIDVDMVPIDNAYQVFVTVTAVRVYNAHNGTVPLVTNQVPANLFLETRYEAERYYTLSSAGLVAFPNSGDLQLQYLSGPSTGNEIEVKWIRVPGAEEYDLEWLWLDEYTYGNGSISANPFWTADPELNFLNNSTRIRTTNNFYRISNIYESGHLLVRIRAVGKAMTPVSLVQMGNPEVMDIYSSWSWPDQAAANNPQPSSWAASGGGSMPWYINLAAASHESGKNWVYTGTYAEEGKRSEVVSYFDGAQYNRQTVTRNNSDNKAIVAETYYDYVGRPSIQALPTPVNDATIKFYQYLNNGKLAFNFNGSPAVPFDKKVFSEGGSPGACASAGNVMVNVSGAGQYYSAANSFQNTSFNMGYTPDAEGYPYTQTEYLPDNTGRVARQSGVGAAMKIETAVGPKHDTRYLYGSVRQDELDRLFGSEAGNADHYSKKMVIDQNGVASITYMNQEGKTVATALAGSPPANMDPLLASNGTNLSTLGTFVETDLLNKNAPGDYNTPNDKNILEDDALVFTEQIILESAQTYSFNYTLLSTSNCYSANPGDCPNICYDCVYDLEFDIKDNCGNRPTGFSKITYSLGTISGSYPTYNTSTTLDNTGWNQNVNFSFSQILATGQNSLAVALDAGMYTVTKRLTVNQQALAAYLSDYVQNCVDNIGDYNSGEAGNFNATGCDISCKTCALQLGTEAAYIASHTDMSADDAKKEFRGLLNACLEPCAFQDPCKTTIEFMLMDVSPGGQYGEYEGTGANMSGASFPVSVFNEMSKLSRNNTTWGPWKHPENYEVPGQNSYVDENGNIDKIVVTHLGGTSYDPQLDGNMNPTPVLVPGTTDQYYVRPQDLFLLSDFMSFWKPSWAKSLLKYHPEYAYIKWCLKNKSRTNGFTVDFKVYDQFGNWNGTNVETVNVYSSNDYDSLLAAIEDIDDITPAMRQKVFDPIVFDPYWQYAGKYYTASTSGNPSGVTLPKPSLNWDTTGVFQRQNSSTPLSLNPADFSAISPFYNQQKPNKTANNRFLNYKNTGYSIIQLAALYATPLANQPGQSLASLMGKLINNTGQCTVIYYPASPSPFSGPPTGPQDWNYILNLKKPCSGSTDDSYKRKAWDTYKMLYLSLKQEMQFEAANSYVMNSNNRGCNDCIGKNNFDVTKVKYTTYGNQAIQMLLTNYISSPNSGWQSLVNGTNLPTLVADISNIVAQDWYKYNSSHPLNQYQQCGTGTKGLYASKAKRYPPIESSELDPDEVANNNGAAIYQQTGLCPNAYDLQGFINGLLTGGGIYNTSPYNLSSNVPEFSSTLYKAIAVTITSPFVDANYVKLPQSTSQNLIGQISIGAKNSDLILSLPASVAAPIPAGVTNWGNYTGGSPAYTITSFFGLYPTSASAFTIGANVAVSNNPPTSHTIALTGTSGFIKLTGCTFIPPCTMNGNGDALNALLNALSGNAEFAKGTNINLVSSSVPTPYSYVFTNTFKSLLETPGNSNNNWFVYYDNITKQINIRDGGTSNKWMMIQLPTNIPFVPVGSPPGSPPDINCIQAFHNFEPQPQVVGGFKADGVVANTGNWATICPSGTFQITGTVQVSSYSGGVWGSFVPVKLANCQFDIPGCNSKEHQTKKELEALVLDISNGSGFKSFVNQNTSNLTGNQLLTPLLRSYINGPSQVVNPSGVPQQNYYWWVKDVANSTSWQITGWLTVNNSQTAPTSVPNVGCKIVMNKKTASGTPLGTLIQNATVPTMGQSILLFGNVSYGSYQNFKLAISGDSILVNTTCYQLRACPGNNGCVTTVYPKIQDFSLPLTNPFTLKRQINVFITPVNYPAGSSGNINLNNWSAVLINNPAPYTNLTLDHAYTKTVCPPTSGQCAVNSVVSLGAVTGNALIIKNDRNCSGGGLTPGTRYIEYDQNFNVTKATNYSINIPIKIEARGSLCDGNPPNFIDMAYPEFVGVSIDNSPVYTNNNVLFPGGGPPFISQFVINQAIGPLTVGSHNLKITFYCANLSDVYTLTEIGLYETDAATASLPCPSNLNTWPTDTMPSVEYVEPCAQFMQNITDNSAQVKFEANLDSLKNAFVKKYIKRCLGRAVETLNMRYSSNEYNYTLYYYDQAGNLARTVPPEGVRIVNLNSIYSGAQTNREAIKEDRTNYNAPSYAKKLYTQHKFQTTYQYNSLNQLVRQETPDAGVSKFYYDNLGRLVASQNAQQNYQGSLNPSGNKPYSYTRYDELGRITMVGQLGTVDLDSYSPIPSGQTIKDVLSHPNYPFNLAIFSGSHKEVTQTYYGDENGNSAVPVVAGYFTNGRQNLRNRVADVTIEETYDGQNNTFDHGTHYSYDIHGNVKELVQENYELVDYWLSGQRLKHMAYEYDLISGKVNEVRYQYGKPDMMMHRYNYDASNRLTNVYTSRNGIIWDQDAKYYYYLHGPLARVEIGEHKVQGIDYAYTIQGWIKGVNSEALKPDNDMGKDGYSTLGGASNSYNLHRFNARDGYGYAINYYTTVDALNAVTENDYLPVNGAHTNAGTYFLGTKAHHPDAAPGLYNGNISQLSASYLSPNPTPITLANIQSPVTVNKYEPYCFVKSYRYDQLNRIRSSRTIGEALNASNAWVLTNPALTANELSENFRYDQNGNLLDVERGLNPSGNYDDLTYYYYDESGVAFNPQTAGPSVDRTNKLAYVADAGNAATLADDIDNQAANNYSYDKIGNLVADAAENISNISWTVYGKIKSITRNNPAKPNLEFRYDATGNRVSKKVIYSANLSITTYYVRDAQGNVMATYEREVNGPSPANSTQVLSLVEQGLYGSKRLGMLAPDKILETITNGANSVPFGLGLENKRILGKKSFEMGNHLDNVLAVISDRKLCVDGNADNIADYFVTDLRTVTDYYAFGSPMPGRQFNGGSYRYSFNGKEKDDEVKGIGNSYDFDARIYDPRICRWLSLDPLAGKYPYHSAYQFGADNPIVFVDIDGNDIKPMNEAAKTLILESVLKVFKTSDVFYINKKGFLAINKKEYKKAMKNLWSDNQKSLAKGLKDVIKSNKYHLRVFAGDNSVPEFNDKVRKPDEVNTLFDARGKPYEVRKVHPEFEVKEKNDKAGATAVFDQDTEYSNYGWVFMNTDLLKKLSNADQKREGVPELSKSGTFFHEVLDHFRNYMKTGKLEDRTKTKAEQVESYNRATKETGEGQRTGDTH